MADYLPNKISAEATAALLELQGRSRTITPHAVVAAAADENSPLHSLFCWDDTVAAAQWRLTQARTILRVAVVQTPQMNEPTQAFVTLSSDKRNNTYRQTIHVLQDEQSRACLIRDALTALEHVRRKYENLVELAEVFAALDNVRSRRKAKK